MQKVEEDKNANILKIVELTKDLTEQEVRDLTNVAIGISIASKENVSWLRLIIKKWMAGSVKRWNLTLKREKTI